MSQIVTFGSYTLGDLILAEIQAHNNDGWGPISNPNTGNVVAQSQPTVAPTGLTGTSTQTSISLSWSIVSGNS